MNTTLDHHLFGAKAICALAWVLLAFPATAEKQTTPEPPHPGANGAPPSSVVQRLLKEARVSGTLPEGVVLRVRADMGKTGTDAGIRQEEQWEFADGAVHRLVIATVDGKHVLKRVESRPCDARALCAIALEGKLCDMEDMEGEGKSVLFAGTAYDVGLRSIEVLRDGKTLLEVGECCVFGGYPETKARAFAALYEELASLARRAFAAKAPPNQ